MTKPMMPYGSSHHSNLIVKVLGKDRLAEQLAGAALSGTGGHLIKRSGGKNAVRQDGASPLVRRNAQLAGAALSGTGGHLTKGGGGKNSVRQDGAAPLVRRNGRLADVALASAGGYLARGGMGKVAFAPSASRLVRLNSAKN